MGTLGGIYFVARTSTKRQTRREAGAQSPRASLPRREAAGPPKGVFLANPIAWADSEVERVQELVIEEVDALLRCPAESKEAAAHEALSRLESHLEVALEALEIVGRVRRLTEVEFVRRGAFMMLLDLSRLPGHG